MNFFCARVLRLLYAASPPQSKISVLKNESGLWKAHAHFEVFSCARILRRIRILRHGGIEALPPFCVF
ncbi:MAG: hypothetical protein DBX55_08250 [Verrucomicrobia bacterium]|nr:MAG: hypothetical protein DBX55_08250 [Verrucomicrobiota bacterium]